MSRIIWIALLLISSIACGREEKLLPLQEEKLVAVLMDIHVAEAAVQHLAGPIKDSTAEKYYEQIFAIHGISEADFDTSIVRLRENPDRLRKIYARVLASLDSTRTVNE